MSLKHTINLIRVLSLSLCLALAAGFSAAAEPQIWFSVPPSKEYMKLFSSDAEWPQSLRHIGVFELSTQFASTTGDRTLNTIFAFLQQKHIALALEVPIQTPGPGNCGAGIEGYRPPDVVKTLIARFRSLGANLQYVSMDEPFWFGHLFNGEKRGSSAPCRAEINDIARNVANNVAVIRSSYPNVAIGEDEPLPNPYRHAEVPPDLVDQMQRWMDAFARTTGQPLAFIHFDIGWFPGESPADDAKNHSHWVSELARAQEAAKAHHIRSGIYYNGNPQDADGTAWVSHAIERYKEVEGQEHLQFDDIIFQTWMRQPELLLPETAPGTMTNLVFSYLKFKGSAE